MNTRKPILDFGFWILDFGFWIKSMSILPVIIDSRPEFLRLQDRDMSLLLLPVGSGTLLGYLKSQIEHSYA